ncbi:MAG: hypothetical protein JO032_17945 [Alphaproteobacteria bacterium]|nr:hypothetical protein [Alphaproteobacteria bacterium]
MKQAAVTVADQQLCHIFYNKTARRGLSRSRKDYKLASFALDVRVLIDSRALGDYIERMGIPATFWR